jgi:alkylation response protein AidB-like acyl-CoA dehydrogenase
MTVSDTIEERVSEAPVVRPAVQALRDGGDEAIIAAAHEVAARLAPRAAGYDRQGVYPAESIQNIWDAGLAALTIPEEFGGVGAPIATTARAIEILSIADSATALVLVWGFGQHRLINAPGSKYPEHWRRRLAQDALEAPALMNGLRVEPELGTPARGGIPATTATRTTAEDGSPAWRINGHKIYCTGSYGLRWLPVWVATEETDPDGIRVGTILVQSDAPGVEIIPTWDHLGMRASVGHDITFTDVVVPFDNAINLDPFTGTDSALALRDDPLGILATANLLSLAVYTGVAKAAREHLIEFLNDRVPTNLGKPLSSLPRFQLAIGEIDALLYNNEQLVFGLAADIDRRLREGSSSATRQTSLVGSESSVIKHIVSRNVIAVTEIALSVTGNPGLNVENHLERHHRDALCSRVHTPQSDLILTGLGRTALGLK